MREGIFIPVVTGVFFAALGAVMTALAIKYATPSLYGTSYFGAALLL